MSATGTSHIARDLCTFVSPLETPTRPPIRYIKSHPSDTRCASQSRACVVWPGGDVHRRTDGVELTRPCLRCGHNSDPKISGTKPAPMRLTVEAQPNPMARKWVGYSSDMYTYNVGIVSSMTKPKTTIQNSQKVGEIAVGRPAPQERAEGHPDQVRGADPGRFGPGQPPFVADERDEKSVIACLHRITLTVYHISSITHAMRIAVKRRAGPPSRMRGSGTSRASLAPRRRTAARSHRPRARDTSPYETAFVPAHP